MAWILIGDPVASSVSRGRTVFCAFLNSTKPAPSEGVGVVKNGRTSWGRDALVPLWAAHRLRAAFRTLRPEICLHIKVGVTPFVIFCAAAAGSLAVAYLLSRETRRTKQALPRLVVTTGIVRELETVVTSREAGLVRSQTLVNVDFVVGGKAYSCRTLYLFAGNRHVGDVGKKFDFPPGQEVGVHYDSADPRLNALVIDTPRRDSSVFAVIVAMIFAVLAAVTWF